ncbi:hypothetical protein CEUSTIGMA_g563.t1 [Chlamydomonas eustigma]|uniref:S5 DRBM domain-containing protein n=1 Tax=Chlamydomonas eustigma TaxID=1157962 RepID=A0A250WRD5_9CHLO|nr:hypothetical protein CEUSTIGMA_g563.t1 [Chlamydomonas eustigma]|eukprot:GAX73110.1 hypothetical protein CEUSTIGMA_g563.t1 [Chlamydomonas eustigma]
MYSGSSPSIQHALRQEQTRFSCGIPGMGGFAASGLNAPPKGSPSPACGNANPQMRGAATGISVEEGDGEASSLKSGTSGRPRLKATSNGEDDDDTLPIESRNYKRRRKKDSRDTQPWSRQQRDEQESMMNDNADPLGFRMMARQNFLKKPIEMIPIPEHIREVLYKFHWDKVLIDVRRTVSLAPRGKVEVYTAMTAVGNFQGLLGLGLGEAATALDAVAKAHMECYSNLTYVPLYRGHTIYHRIDHEFHHMKMRLMPRPEGWGVKASDLVSELCGLAGIKNISIKMVGRSKNKFYVAHCLKEALTKQSVPHDGVEGSGVYVREIFRGTGLEGRLPMGIKRGVDIL